MSARAAAGPVELCGVSLPGPVLNGSGTFDALAARQSYPLPAPAIALAVDAFVRVHGFTVMEVFGQLRPLVMPADAYYEQLLTELVASLGLSRAS